MTTFAGTGFCLIATTESSNYATVTALNILFATLPTMIMTNILFYLMACPCAVHDESSSSDCMNSFYHCLEKIGSNCALVMLSIGVTFMCFGILMFLESGDEGPGFVAFASSVFQSYLLWFLVKVCTDFIPSPGMARLMRKITLGRGLCCHFGASHLGACGFIPFGTWLAEREVVLEIVRKAIDERGPAYLLIENKDLDQSFSAHDVEASLELSKPNESPSKPESDETAAGLLTENGKESEKMANPEAGNSVPQKDEKAADPEAGNSAPEKEERTADSAAEEVSDPEAGNSAPEKEEKIADSTVGSGVVSL